MPLPQMPDVPNEEIRNLIAKGWTPPASTLEQYRHLVEPFNAAKNFTTSKPMDKIDVENLKAIIAVFEHFGLELPPQMPSERRAA